MSAVTFPSGLTLAEARSLLVGVSVEVAAIRLGPDGQTGTMIAPPWDKTITNVTRTALIFDGGTRHHSSVNIATGATAPKHGAVTKIQPPQAQRIRDLLGVAAKPIPEESAPRQVMAAAAKQLHRDLTERNPLDEATLSPAQQIVMIPRSRLTTPEAVLDVMHDLRSDALALHLAALDTLGRVPACPCGAVSTVFDRAAQRNACDACAPEHARGNHQPWAPLVRAVGRLTTLPGSVL